MSRKYSLPELNAGSMADIAFLLLVFFLMVTVIQSEVGIKRQLPRWADGPTAPIADNNILLITLNQNSELMIDDEYKSLDDIQELVISFVDNNRDGSCDYCLGTRLTNLSDNPHKAVVSIASDRGTSYASYISVQNEVAAAINKLREDMAIRVYGETLGDLKPHLQEKVIRAYPLLVSEAEVMAPVLSSAP